MRSATRFSSAETISSEVVDEQNPRFVLNEYSLDIRVDTSRLSMCVRDRLID